jgi:hypothetical protein
MAQQVSGSSYVRRLIEHLDSIDGGYGDPDNPESAVRIILGLTGGVVLRGTLVSPDRFIEENTERRNGGTWPSNRAIFAKQDDEGPYAHLTNVEYLSGGHWVRGSSAAVGVGFVTFSGDRW